MVIVVALFIVALTAAMAVVMLARIERDTRRTALITHDVQADAYAQGSIAWAIDELKANWAKQKPNQLVDQFPLESPEIDVAGYKIKSTIYDLQAKFNLNNINTTEAQNDFKRLLHFVDKSLTEEQAQEIVSAITDWSMLTGGDPALQKYYQKQTPPYRAAHRLFVHVSELLLVKGMTPTLYEKLKPYVVALPSVPTPINLQTADAPVLFSLSPNLTADAVTAFMQYRKQKPIRSIDGDILKKLNIADENLVTNKSKYFLVETEVSSEKQRLLIETVLERLPNEESIPVTIIWQNKGA